MTARVWTILLLAVLLASCASDPTSSSEYLDLQQERDDLAARIAELEALPPIVEQFKAAYESGDLDEVRGIYTEDGIWATTANVYELYYGQESHIGEWGTDGYEFARTATLHAGELEILGAIQVGDNAAAFGWRWSDFASGTGTLHLRGGKIVVASLSVTEFEIPPLASS
ncbi:MAG: nuclear transport factor 2 family protein [Acidimicrobiia bacterium]|nr:nuclear transport factor 2 family protein [Acidimicrobiia bacterium]